MLINALARNWWMVLLRGIVAIVFGVAAIAWPDLTVGVLVALFGAYALVDGIFTIVAAFQAQDSDRLLHIAEGALGIIIGLIAWVYPGLTALSLLYFIAAWALITGVIEIIAAIRLRRQIDNEWFLILSGAISVIFGLLLIVRPRDSALALVTVIGIFAIVFGVLLIAFSFRLRGMQDRAPAGGSQNRAPAGAS